MRSCDRGLSVARNKGTNIYSIISFVCELHCLNLWFWCDFFSVWFLLSSSSFEESNFCIFDHFNVSFNAFQGENQIRHFGFVYQKQDTFLFCHSFSLSLRSTGLAIGCDNYLRIYRGFLRHLLLCVSLKSVKRIRFWENNK